MLNKLVKVGEQLCQLCEKELGVMMTCEVMPNCVQLYDESGSNELSVVFAGQYRVGVEQVLLSKQRQGVFSKIARILLDYCVENDVTRFMILSVSTPEMQAWCQNNGLSPIKSTCMETANGVLVGDYAVSVQEYKEMKDTDKVRGLYRLR